MKHLLSLLMTISFLPNFIIASPTGIPPIFKKHIVEITAPDDILGTWWSPDKDGQIEFFKKNGQYFGKLIWSINDKPGNPVKDTHNPVVAMRDARLVGMVFFKNLTYNNGTYEDGSVYDSRSGTTYSCNAWLESKDILKIRGFVGFSVLGKTTTMTRVK